MEKLFNFIENTIKEDEQKMKELQLWEDHIALPFKKFSGYEYRQEYTSLYSKENQKWLDKQRVKFHRRMNEAQELFTSKHGAEIHKLLNGQWNRDIVNEYLDSISDDIKWPRIIDYLSALAGIGCKNYSTYQEQIDDLLYKMEELYKLFK